ncbi:hypothetical protein [Alcanivorax sp.]|uniref:hypothetical protein n=1 Tax=Alcanivorax sp. TaxID=1872427 RepID=UPI002635C5C8|nr:hypothetical protein [Alcanivorax sp.]
MKNKSILLLFAFLLGTPCTSFGFFAFPSNPLFWTHETLPQGSDYIYIADKGEFRWGCNTENQLNGAFLFNGTEEEGRSYLKMARDSNLKQKEKLNVVWRIDGGKEHSGNWLTHYRWPGTAAALPTGVMVPPEQHSALLTGMKKGLKMDIRVENEQWQYHSSFSLERFTKALTKLSCYKE